MKKFYSLFLLMAVAGYSNSQCTIDNTNTQFFSPTPDNVPCAKVGTPYDETLQLYIPTEEVVTISGFSITVYIDSVVLNSITGLPNGLSYVSNPAGPTFLPGTNGCGRTTGTTNDPVGNYPIAFNGLIYINATVPGFGTIDTNLTIQQYIQQKYGKTFSIDVVANGAQCTTTGIGDVSTPLNAEVKVMPNPNNGVFVLSIQSASRLNGTVSVIDVTGRTIYAEAIDLIGGYNQQLNFNNQPKGIYTLLIKTAEGVITKSISVE